MLCPECSFFKLHWDFIVQSVSALPKYCYTLIHFQSYKVGVGGTHTAWKSICTQICYFKWNLCFSGTSLHTGWKYKCISLSIKKKKKKNVLCLYPSYNSNLVGIYWFSLSACIQIIAIFSIIVILQEKRVRGTPSYLRCDFLTKMILYIKLTFPQNIIKYFQIFNKVWRLHDDRSYYNLQNTIRNLCKNRSIFQVQNKKKI